MSPNSAAAAREKALADLSAAEGRLRRALDQGGFAVALSGGGHRATLAAIGTLLALLDRRLNRHVLQIASISGGSIANGAIAQRCAYETLEPGQLDDIAAEVCTTVVERGVLTRAWIIGGVVGSVVSGFLVAVLLVWAGLDEAWAVLAAALGIIAASSALMMAGHLVEWRLDRAYFRPVSRQGEGAGRARISSLSGRTIDHVFGTTDLVLGQPVYVSSGTGGIAYRRVGRTPDPAFKVPPFHTFGVGDWSIAAVVRASAGFPGIPPRRTLMPGDPKVLEGVYAPRVAFLADGGIWNNLGSHILREDKFMGTYCGIDADGVPRPHAAAPNMPLLIMNGSQSQRPSKPLLFHIPGLALLIGLLQVLIVLNANTVEPRVEQMLLAQKRRVWAASRPESLDPVNLIVDLREPDELRHAYQEVYSEDSIRESDPAIRKWRDHIASVALQAVSAATEGRASDVDLVANVRANPKPEGSYPVPGFANIEDWDKVVLGAEWAKVVELEGDARIDVPTTLDRIEPLLARRVVARAYTSAHNA